jgi:hypothetical protein
MRDASVPSKSSGGKHWKMEVSRCSTLNDTRLDKKIHNTYSNVISDKGEGEM